MSKWKFFNFRPLFFIFTMLVVSIFSANYIRDKLYLSIAILVLTLIILLFYCIKYKKFMTLIACLVTICIGFTGFYLQKKEIENYDVDFAGKSVYGVVDSVQKTSYGKEFVITNVELNGESLKTNCNVRLLNNEVLEDFNVGDKIIFVVEEVEKLDLYNSELPNSNNIKKNIKYQLTTKEVVVSGSEQSLKVKLQQKIKENLALGLDNDKVNLMYSSLFGDKTELNPMIKDSFSSSGVAHLLAVSGLHVGLIVGILMAILTLLKCNKYVRFGIIFAFLIFYCYLCGWSASIVRASIMTIVLLGAPLVFSEYDTLSSISFAGISILLVNPTALFDISFLLSFMCVFGISMFYPYVVKFLNKIHLNNPVTQIFAISIITNISTLFVMIYYFEEVSFIGILANIFILPLFTFVFSVVFIVAMISLIMPFVCKLLTIIAPLINLVIVLSNFFASITIDLVPIKISYLAIILFGILLLFLSKYNVKGLVVKFLSVNVFLVLLISQIVLNLKVIGL